MSFDIVNDKLSPNQFKHPSRKKSAARRRKIEVRVELFCLFSREYKSKKLIYEIRTAGRETWRRKKVSGKKYFCLFSREYNYIFIKLR